MLTTLWKNWNDDKQNYFRDLLWEKKYVHLASYQWELQVTTAGKEFIKDKEKELEEAFFGYLIEEREVTQFITDNFIKPDDLSPETENATDDGVVFLRNLKKRNLITFDEGALEQVNTWIIPKGKNKHKRWFNNLTGKLIVTPINPFRERKPGFVNNPDTINIPSEQKNPIVNRIKKISLLEWGFIIALLGFVITVWIYVISPLIK
ncbi:MAG: hypothetical protein JSU01_02675 [Bacteroidetes bacterium]|nr:hypothetical protein [Bacteroidota bacterium]